MPTAFTSRERLIDALFLYDTDNQCEVYSDEENDVVTVRYRLEDFIFSMDQKTGCYRLTIRNAGTCRQMVERINAIQDAYLDSVQQLVVAQLYGEAQQRGWVVESDTIDDQATRTISLFV